MKQPASPARNADARGVWKQSRIVNMLTKLTLAFVLRFARSRHKQGL